MLSKKLNVILMLTILGSASSCAHLSVPCPESCSSFGKKNGGRCKELCSTNARDLSPAEWDHFIEAQIDNPSTPQNEGKGPAVCYSGDDDSDVMTVIEQACVEIKCTYEQREKLALAMHQQASLRREAIQTRRTGRRAPITRP